MSVGVPTKRAPSTRSCHFGRLIGRRTIHPAHDIHDAVSDLWLRIHGRQPSHIDEIVCTFKQGHTTENLKWHDSLRAIRSGSHGLIVKHQKCNTDMQSAKRPRMILSRSNLGDGQALMQMTASRSVPIHPLVQYAFSHRMNFQVVGYSTAAESTLLRGYLHFWRDRGRVRRDYRFIRLWPNSDPYARVASTWREHWFLHWTRPSITPVRPMPSLIAEPTPVWIITDHDSEHFVPILVDYVSEERVFTASALVNGQQGFPLVLDIFRLVVPANSCAIRTVCFIRTNGRHYTHRQSIPILCRHFPADV